MNTNYYFTAQNQNNVPQSYIPDVLEGNWYEDRCKSEYYLNKKKDYKLPNPNSWMYETTYNELGQNWKNFPSIQKTFAISNDNYINFQAKTNKEYITTNKNAIPGDSESPMITSGLRLGSPAMTTRGLKEEDMVEIGKIIASAVTISDKEIAEGLEIYKKVLESFC